MTNPNSRTTRLKEFITKLYPSAHGHQVKAFGAFVAVLLEAKSCTQAKLAATFENKKAAVKRLSRFLHNPRLRTADRGFADVLLFDLLDALKLAWSERRLLFKET